MTYPFQCENEECNNIEEKSIPIDDYDKEKDKQVCSKCGAKMFRIIEFNGAIGATGGYDSVAGNAKWQS